jgi:hypothetical protein
MGPRHSTATIMLPRPRHASRDWPANPEPIAVTDDWPEVLPVSDAEVRIIEAHLGHVLDDLFGRRQPAFPAWD